ncbi:hypothetical protein Tco_0421944 [Tanacetum coccineum]
MKATMAWRCRAYDGFGERLLIIMANVIPPDHVDDLPVVEPNKLDDVPVILEPVLVDEDEDPEEEEFEEEEEPQEEEDDMDPKDVIEVEDTAESEDETIPASVHEVVESFTAPFLREDNDGMMSGLTRRDINSLFVRSSVEEGAATMENLVRKLSNAEEKDKCKKLKKELEEARFSNTLLRMQNERVKRDLYWTRV